MTNSIETNAVKTRKPRAAKKEVNLYDLIDSVSNLHPDDYLFVQSQIKARHHMGAVADSTLYLKNQMQEMEQRLRTEMQMRQDEQLKLMARMLTEQQNALMAFWGADQKPVEVPLTTPEQPQRAPRLKLLVYGLNGAQKTTILERVTQMYDRIDCRCVERSDRVPAGTYDAVVTSRFVKHPEIDALKVNNPHLNVITAHGGVTNILRQIEAQLETLH